ncbi:MAG: hypothetical protein ACI9HK_005978, partial [Pirellulaceae bacterium]
FSKNTVSQLSIVSFAFFVSELFGHLVLLFVSFPTAREGE